MIDKADRFTAASPAGSKAGDNLPCDEEDFDALLAGSSFGSEQARAIREQTPAAAREHARRVLAGEEKCAPVEGDIDDAVGGLVCGLARGVVPGPTALILDGSALTLGGLATAWSGRGHPAAMLLVLAACQTDVLWPDHRARLLQALIDHNALVGLRPDVALNIVNCAFDMPRPPRVLRQCAALAVEQIDVSALAGTWLASVQSEAADRRRTSYLMCHRVTDFPDNEAAREGLHQPVPRRAALTGGFAMPEIAVREDHHVETQRSPRRVRPHPQRSQLAPRTVCTPPLGRRPGAGTLFTLVNGVLAGIGSVYVGTHSVLITVIAGVMAILLAAMVTFLK